MSIVAAEFGLEDAASFFLRGQVLVDAGADNAILQPAKGPLDLSLSAAWVFGERRVFTEGLRNQAGTEAGSSEGASPY